MWRDELFIKPGAVRKGIVATSLPKMKVCEELQDIDKYFLAIGSRIEESFRRRLVAEQQMFSSKRILSN